MKTLKQYLVKESRGSKEDILDLVDDYFWSHSREDGYMNARDRIHDLEDLADGNNIDSWYDFCVDYISDTYDNANDFEDEICDRLMELAEKALEYDD